MRVLHHGLWLVLIVILQAAIINAVKIFGINANLFLCFVLAVGFLCGRAQGIACGVIFGLVYDIFVGRFVVVSALSFAAVGYFAAVFSDRFFGDPSAIVFGAAGMIASLLYDAVYALPYLVVYESLSWLAALRIFAVGAVMNGVLSVIMLVCVIKTLAVFKIKNTKILR